MPAPTYTTLHHQNYVFCVPPYLASSCDDDIVCYSKARDTALNQAGGHHTSKATIPHLYPTPEITSSTKAIQDLGCFNPDHRHLVTIARDSG